MGKLSVGIGACTLWRIATSVALEISWDKLDDQRTQIYGIKSRQYADDILAIFLTSPVHIVVETSIASLRS
jgi:hypothetical protein